MLHRRLAAFTKDFRIGPGIDPANNLGPLISQEQLDRVCGYLDSGAKEGAKTVVGGHKIGDKGYFVEPTLLVDVRPDMKVVREEIFGPVVTAIPVSECNYLRSGRGRVDPRSEYRAPYGGQTPRRDSVDQLLQRLRFRASFRRLQAVRLGPRDGPRCSGALHGS